MLRWGLLIESSLPGRHETKAVLNQGIPLNVPFQRIDRGLCGLPTGGKGHEFRLQVGKGTGEHVSRKVLQLRGPMPEANGKALNSGFCHGAQMTDGCLGGLQLRIR